MQILECKVDPLQEESEEVMVIPVRSGSLQGVKISCFHQGYKSFICLLSGNEVVARSP